MGQVGSAERGPGPYLLQSRRFAVEELTISDADDVGTPGAGAQNPTAPGAAPLLKVSLDPRTLQIGASRADGRPLEFVQDPATLQMVLKVPYRAALAVAFRLHLVVTPKTDVASLTFVWAESRKQIDALVDMDLAQNPNAQEQENIVLIGDFTSDSSGAPAVLTPTFNWAWTPAIDAVGGGAVHFAFCEYDKHNHKLAPLAGGQLWLSERPEQPGYDGAAFARMLSPGPGETVEPFSPETSAVLSPLRDISLANIPSIPMDPVGGYGFAGLPAGLQSGGSVGTGLGAGLGAGGSGGGVPAVPSVGPTAAGAPTPAQPIPQPAVSLAPSPGATAALTPGNTSLSGPSALPAGGVEREPAQRPDAQQSAQPEDGPVFRTTLTGMEKRAAALKADVKTIYKRALLLHERVKSVVEAERWFGMAVGSAARTDIPALRAVAPFYNTRDFGWTSHRSYLTTLANDLVQHVITPLRDMYENEIKSFDVRKRDFDMESNQYYTWMSRNYLSTKKDNRDKSNENDAKYSQKRRAFELARFDYFTYLMDLHGGRKLQYMVLQLGLFGQRLTEMSAALGTDFGTNTRPYIDETVEDLRDASREWGRHRTEREMNRRALERSMGESLGAPQVSSAAQRSAGTSAGAAPTTVTRIDTNQSTLAGSVGSSLASPPVAGSIVSGTTIADISATSPIDENETFPEVAETPNHKEGLLWALSKPGGLQEVPNLQKQGLKWHKYWVVQDAGKLCEYTNWKQGAALHNEPIDLKVATVREARTADRRFCFEVVTPNYKRVYQAPSDEDMKRWIDSITRGISTSLGAFNGGSAAAGATGTIAAAGSSGSGAGSGGASAHDIFVPKVRGDAKEKLEKIGRKLSLKTDRQRGAHAISSPLGGTNTTPGGIFAGAGAGAVGSHSHSNGGTRRPSEVGGASGAVPGAPNTTLLTQLQKQPSNRTCGDCGATSSVEWVSINLMMILCIDCSGAHRSLGAHISKVRSLTLDTVSFTKDLVEALQAVSNQQMNRVWEARLASKPAITEKTRLQYVSEKYVEKLYIDEIEKPNAALRRAISEQSVLGTVQALAARANPNSASDSGEPVLVHALRTAGAAKTFAVAEVLFLNGATVPATIAEDLDTAAKAFLTQRKR